MSDIPPRPVPDRASKYMGLAWIHAGFSKDPNTQVGAQIVSQYNQPLGSGYNGPPRLIDDTSFSWKRTSKNDESGDLSKYDVVVHAEINAIKHSCGQDLTDATLYVTAFPCQACMLEIVKEEIGTVVYMDFKSSSGSVLQNTEGREKALKIAELGGIKVEKFDGNVNWIADWTQRLVELGVFDDKSTC